MDPENCWLLQFVVVGRREGSGNGVRERCKKVGQSKGQPHRRIGQKERHVRPTWQCFDQGGHQGWFRPQGSDGLWSKNGRRADHQSPCATPSTEGRAAQKSRCLGPATKNESCKSSATAPSILTRASIGSVDMAAKRLGVLTAKNLAHGRC